MAARLPPTPKPPPPAWLTYDGRGLRNAPGDRRAMTLLQIVRQFDVEQNPRYRAVGAKTYCKTFVWDVTRALMAEVPHWVDAVGDPAPVGNGNTETTANSIHAWLGGEPGRRHGWRPVGSDEACRLAELGNPVVVSWPNPAGHGHIAVVVPPCIDGVMIAQAGARNFERGRLELGFGSRTVFYFAHD